MAVNNNFKTIINEHKEIIINGKIVPSNLLIEIVENIMQLNLLNFYDIDDLCFKIKKIQE